MGIQADATRSRFHQTACCLMLCGVVSCLSNELLISELGLWKRNWPGDVIDVTISGNRAYISSRGLQIYDITNPLQPTPLGQTTEIGRLYDIFISSQYAYGFSLTGRETALLWVIDITKESAPKVAARIEFPSLIGEILISGTYAYFASGIFIYAVNITDPTAPFVEGEVRISATAFASSTSPYGYVASSKGLVSLDFSDPVHPAPISSVAFPNSPSVFSLAISEGYAYLSLNPVDLQVVDIRNPASLNPVTKYKLPDTALDIEIQQTICYLAERSAGVELIDISNPQEPIRMSLTSVRGSAQAIAISGNYAYVAAGEAGFRLLNISDPYNPSLVGGFPASGSVEAVAVQGRYAYLGGGLGGLHVLDISDSLYPTEVGNFYSMGYTRNLAVQGDIACVLDDYDGIQILDISNPIKPVLLSTFNAIKTADRITLSGNYAYISHQDFGKMTIAFLDITNPSDPFIAGTYTIQTPDFAQSYELTDFVLSGNRLYLTFGGWYRPPSFEFGPATFGGLHIVDISDIGNPARIGAFSGSDSNSGVAVVGDYALLAYGRGWYEPGGVEMREGGVAVVDIRDPSQPGFRSLRVFLTFFRFPSSDLQLVTLPKNS
jgi:hypothetical protein